MLARYTLLMVVLTRKPPEVFPKLTQFPLIIEQKRPAFDCLQIPARVS